MESGEETCTRKEESRAIQPSDQVINTIKIERVPLVDDHRALYTRIASGSDFFFHLKNPLKHSLTTEKVLYVVYNRAEEFPKSVAFIDTFGQEWDLLSDDEIENFNHLGKPIHWTCRASSSQEPTCSPQTRQEKGTCTKTTRDKNTMKIENMQDTSGNLAIRGPTEPLQSSSLHLPVEASRGKQEVSAQDTSALNNAKEQDVQEHGDALTGNKKGKKGTWKERRARRAASRKRRQEEKEKLVPGKQEPIAEPVPLSKEGEYQEGETGNTMLPVEYAGQTIMAILDGGAGMSIITKEVWQLWDKPSMKQTCIKLQLADGGLKKPIGLLERVIATSCKVRYEHTFVVVDFGKSSNFDIILGRPFMRQLKMIQDWGSNYVYLRQPKAITRVNLTDHSYQDVTRTPVDEFEAISLGDDSDVPSWVNSRSRKQLGGESRKEGLNGDHKVDTMSSCNEECIIVPFLTIQTGTSPGESSIQSQQGEMSNSWEYNSTGTPRKIDSTILIPVRSSESSMRLYRTPFGITFELYHPNPPNPNAGKPDLRMYEDPETNDIFYQDQYQNFYRPIPPAGLTEEESMDWFPYLSHMDPSNGQPLYIHRPAMMNTPETMPTSSGITNSKGPEAVRPTHNPPPGFEPKVQPQAINQSSQTGYLKSSAEGSQAQGPSSLYLQEEYAPPMPTNQGSVIQPSASHNEGSLMPVSTSNSTLHMHYTHQGYTAPSPTVASQGGAQIVSLVTPQAYTTHGTIGSAPKLLNHAQPSLHAHTYHHSAHIPTLSHEMEHLRLLNTSLSNYLLQITQASSQLAHIGTSQAHQATQHVPSGNEHNLPSPSLSQSTAGQAPKSLQHLSEKHVDQNQPTHVSTTMLHSHTLQPPLENAHKSQACIVGEPVGSTIQSPSSTELPKKGGAPIFVLSATKSQVEQPSRQGQQEHHPSIKKEVAEASTKQTTQMAASSTNLSKQTSHMRPLYEYMVKGSFQLSAVTTDTSVQGLYEDKQGGQFQILSPFQGQKPDKPRVFKYQHMKTLTYAYKDTEGNEYQQLQKLDDTLGDEEFQKNAHVKAAE